MRSGRRELKEALRQGRRSLFLEEALQEAKGGRRLLASDYSYYGLVKMIAGAGVGVAGAGAGMLRARRRDISIKPNRRLDRKSSRGMIYENEELRLRTIHINAEVEQGQNDIKKLRRENEQLRREIWSLRDEYDKLEEILKKQRSREESDELEERSDEDVSGSEYTEEEETEGSESSGDTVEKRQQDERQENAENQKISSEKLNGAVAAGQRGRINFEELPVVNEEEELRKERERHHEPEQRCPLLTTSFDQPEPQTTRTFVHEAENPFGFPVPGEQPSLADRRKALLRQAPAESPESPGAEGRPRHFFAPLRLPGPLEAPAQGRDSGTSPSSECTASTVVSRGKGSADLCISGVVACEPGDAKDFFGSDSLPEPRAPSPLTKSLSCQELHARGAFPEAALGLRAPAKSDCALDGPAPAARAFRSQVHLTLRRRSPSPTTPEVPQLPAAGYRAGYSPAPAPSGYAARLPGNGAEEPDCDACKRKDLERLRLLIPPASEPQEFHVTSFEGPSPHTLRIPPLTPCELESLRRAPPGSSTPRLYQNVPFTPGARPKVPAQTQTSPQEPTPQDEPPPRRRRSRRDKAGASVRSRKQAAAEEKTGSRSSSSGQENPAEQTKRVSLYLSARKRPSLASTRTSRSRSIDNSWRLSRADPPTDGDADRERTNSLSSRGTPQVAGEKTRKTSTSSGSVPWCACWGNGCL